MLETWDLDCGFHFPIQCGLFCKLLYWFWCSAVWIPISKTGFTALPFVLLYRACSCFFRGLDLLDSRGYCILDFVALWWRASVARSGNVGKLDDVGIGVLGFDRASWVCLLLVGLLLDIGELAENTSSKNICDFLYTEDRVNARMMGAARQCCRRLVCFGMRMVGLYSWWSPANWRGNLAQCSILV